MNKRPTPSAWLTSPIPFVFAAGGFAGKLVDWAPTILAKGYRRCRDTRPTGWRARWSRVRWVLAGRVDQVGPGLRAADLDRAPAELGVKAPGVHIRLADAEVA